MVRALIAALSPILMLGCDYREYTRSVTPPAPHVQHSERHWTTMRNRALSTTGRASPGAPSSAQRGMAKRAAQSSARMAPVP